MQEHLDRVDALLARGEVKKADVLIARRLRGRISPTEQAGLRLRRARVRLLSARPEDAIDDLTAARELLGPTFETPQNLELLADCYVARFELAMVGFAERAYLAQAQQTYQKILEAFPRYENAGWLYYQMGRIAMVSDQVEQAVQLFQQALLHPTTVSSLTAYCYERLGFIAFYEQRELDKALGFFNRAVDTYPAGEDRVWLVQVHLRRSRVLRHLRDFDAALRAAETAVNLASSSVENQSGLAEALLTLGEMLATAGGRDREVVAYLQQFMQNARRPLGVDVTWSRFSELLGDAYFNLGQYEDAVAAYRSALQFNPDHPWEVSLLQRIARSYYQRRAYQETASTIESLLHTAHLDDQPVTDYRVYDMLGSALFALGRYEEAAEAYQQALDIAPSGADVDKIRTYFDYARERI